MLHENLSRSEQTWASLSTWLVYTRSRDQPFCQYRAGDRTYYVFIPASHNGKSSIWKRIGPDSSPKWPKPPWRIIVIYILISFLSFSIEIVRHFHLSLSNNFYRDILHLYNIVIPIINSAAEGWYGQPKYCCKKAIHVVLLRFAVVSGLLVFFFYRRKLSKKKKIRKRRLRFQFKFMRQIHSANSKIWIMAVK